jgi:hypothetical protein
MRTAGVDENARRSEIPGGFGHDPHEVAKAVVLEALDVGVGQPFNDPPLDELKRQRALFALEIALEDLSDETVVGRKSTGI